MQTLKDIIRSLETLVQDAETMTLKDIKSWVRRDLEDLKSLVGVEVLELVPAPEVKSEFLLRELGAILRDDYGFNFTGIWDMGDCQEIPDNYFLEKVYEGSVLCLKSCLDNTHQVHHFHSSDGFTRQQVLDAIISVEKKTRPKTDWFDGPDWHHVFFEGVYLDEDGVGEIYWGS